MFWLRRQLNETPRFQLAQIEAEEADEKAREEGRPTGMRGVLADRRLLRWLIGASLAWFLFDLVYYGNTISSPFIVKLVAPPRQPIRQTAYLLAIFAVSALPGLLPRRLHHRPDRATTDADRRLRLIALAFFALWLIPGATTTVPPFLVLFGATYFFSEFGPNTTTFVYPAEIFPGPGADHQSRHRGGRRKDRGFVGTYALTSLCLGSVWAETQRHRRLRGPAGRLDHGHDAPRAEGQSLEELTEGTPRFPTSATVLGLAESRATRPPPA